MKGYLVMENGRVFTGRLLNNCRMASGEVVFSTAMISYQDIITDPSYYGQIVVMTYPLVGNVGFNEKSYSSSGAMVKGLVLREATDFPSHYEMEVDLISFLNKSEIAVLTEVDTRALTREIRNHGIMGGVITDNVQKINYLREQARKASLELKGDLVRYVSRKNVMQFGEGATRIVFLDLGTKRGGIDSFVRRGCQVFAVPADVDSEYIKDLEPDGIVISDGPGDPVTVPYVVKTLKELIGYKPIFGVGLGHQIIALALGASIHKLPYGHRGTNHPIKDLESGRIYISTQNHGYVVEEGSLASTEGKVRMISLNDATVEGIMYEKRSVFSLQFDPEGFPGYSETGIFIDEFVNRL